jgi:hypothetical protein
MTKIKRDVIIKFLAAEEFKELLQNMADERGVSLSAFIRLVLLEYAKHKS